MVWSVICAGEITFRLSNDTTLMGRTVCLNINVLLRTLIMTLGTIYFMMNYSWQLTFLVLMETPITGLIQNLYNTHYQVRAGRRFEPTSASIIQTCSISCCCC